jgi:hypothetical protein
VPALLLLRWRPWLRHAATVCTLLLAAGALALLLAPGVLGWWLLVLCHGSAWGAAWVAHLQSPGPAPGGGEEPALLLSAAVSASLVLALGLGVSLLGAAALSGGHLALAGVAILSWLATPSAAHRPA